MKIRKRNQGGFIVTIELLVIATILVIGLISGWTALRDSVLAELSDTSESIGSLNQGFMIASVQNAAQSGSSAGSAWLDNADNGTNGTIDIAPGGANGDSNAEYTYTDVGPMSPENTPTP